MPTNTIPQSGESKTDFEVCFVITNGVIKRRFLWVTCRKSGFYFAFASKGGGHQSYHSDGTSHFKTDDGTKIPDFNKKSCCDVCAQQLSLKFQSPAQTPKMTLYKSRSCIRNRSDNIR